VNALLRHLRAQPLGALALLLALSGTAYAAGLPRGSVGTPQLKAGAVTGVKVRNGSLTGADLRPRSVGRGQLAPGAVTSSALGVPLVTKVRLTPGAPWTTWPNGANDPVPFDEAVLDTGDLWDPSEPDRLTIPVSGIWRFDAQAGFGDNSLGSRHVWLSSPYDSEQGGATILGNTLVTLPSSSSSVAVPVAAVVELHAGQTIGLRVYQQSGSALVLDHPNYVTSLTATYLGPAPG
jgi:hypothetical protein